MPHHAPGWPRRTQWSGGLWPGAQRLLLASPFHYTAKPQLVAAEPSVSFRGEDLVHTAPCQQSGVAGPENQAARATLSPVLAQGWAAGRVRARSWTWYSSPAVRVAGDLGEGCCEAAVPGPGPKEQLRAQLQPPRPVPSWSGAGCR